MGRRINFFAPAPSSYLRREGESELGVQAGIPFGQKEEFERDKQ